jgi:large subunit ribosomal protein L9
MKVVLLQNVDGLGSVGEVKEVAKGYGRNFLLPRGLAERATPDLMKRAEAMRRAEEHRQSLADAEMAVYAETFEGLEVMIKAKAGAQDRLYGAITNADIAEEVQRITGQDMDKRKIELDEPIHKLGEYEVVVRLSKELTPRLKVIVAGEPEEVKPKPKPKAKAKPKKEEKAEDVAEETPQVMTEDVVEETPQVMTEDVAEETPQVMTKDVAEETPQVMTEDVVEETSQAMTEDVVEETSQAMAEEKEKETEIESPEEESQ